MMKDKDILENLILFIRNEIREFNTPITENTLIEDGLGVTGDDASDLIQNFSTQFNVDISNFLFSKYFYDEPSIFLDQEKRSAFTIGDLQKAILTGRLDEETINKKYH